jgi:hypothetical protein
MSAVVPFTGALFGLSHDVQGPIIMACPPHADREIENKVCIPISAMVFSTGLS